MLASNRSQPPGEFLAAKPENTALDRVFAVAQLPLLPNEGKEEFSALATHLVAAAQPRDAIEEILVRDVIDLTWEIRRLRRAKAGVLTVAMGDGVTEVLQAIGYPDRLAQNLLGVRWVACEEDARRTVHKALSDANLSIDDVTAKTMEVRLDSIERLDRLLASSEARRNNALREIDRHREALGAEARRAVEEAEDVEFAEVETGVVHSSSD